jgi:hypothetical protein
MRARLDRRRSGFVQGGRGRVRRIRIVPRIDTDVETDAETDADTNGCNGWNGYGTCRSESGQLEGDLPPLDLGLHGGAFSGVPRGQRAHARQQPLGRILIAIACQSTELMSDPDQLPDLVVVHPIPLGWSAPVNPS